MRDLPMPRPDEFEVFIKKEEEKVKAFLRNKFPHVPTEDVEDVIQESATALFDNIRNRKYKKEDCSLSTYYMSICHRQMLKHLRKQGSNPFVPVEESLIDIYNYKTDNIDFMVHNASSPDILDKLDLKEMVKNLPEPCKTILWGFYWMNLKMKALADMCGLKGEDSAKTTKSRCMTKFKDAILQIIEDNR